MSSEPPKPGAVPGWGQPPDATPTEPVPAPAAPDPAPGWGQPAAPVTPEPAAPPPAAPEPVAPAPTEPAPAAPAAPGWGQPPAAAPVPPAPAPPAPQAPQGPPPAGAWGAPPPAGFAPGGAAPGGVPPNWVAEPAPPAKGNGCLKACLIVGVILVILAAIFIGGLILIGGRIAGSITENIDSNGNLKECPFVSNSTLDSVLGSGVEASPLTGFFDATLGLVLDKRVLRERRRLLADHRELDRRELGLRVGSPATRAVTLRRCSNRNSRTPSPPRTDQGNGLSVETEGYYGGPVTGVGDEAFCTDTTLAGQGGILVRKGDTLVYVSLMAPNASDTCQTAAKGGRGDPQVVAGGRPAKGVSRGGAGASGWSGEPNSRSSQDSSGDRRSTTAPRRTAAEPGASAASGGASSAMMNGISRGMPRRYSRACCAM